MCKNALAALTPSSSIPKMALQIQEPRSYVYDTMEEADVLANPTDLTAPRSLFRVIATDIHFWIPFAVLVAGLFLLDKLR